MGDTGTPRPSSSSSAANENDVEKEEEAAPRGGDDMVLVGDTITFGAFPVRVFSVDSELRARPKS